MMEGRCYDGQCAAPPHPDLLERLQADLLKVQGTIQEQSLRAHTHAIISKDRSGRNPGLNDGMIFPPSQFHDSVPFSALSRAAAERTPLRGPINVILVLVDFQDLKIGEGAKDHIRNLFFSEETIATGSVNEYYKEVSNGKISLVGDVIGPFTLSQKKEFYANNKFGKDWPEPNSVTMAEETVRAMTGAINFDKYDNDKNGLIDVFCVVHAGTGGERSGNPNDIWSVKWTLNDKRSLGNVSAFGFLTIPEDATIGVSAHEIGHLLFGWPDLYDTDNSSVGVGDWCVMSYGNWGKDRTGNTPVHPSAWCKANQGWIDVVNETENRQITVADVKSGFKVHRLWTNGDKTSQEYFLIENRQMTGFDKSLPAEGLLVWHIDDLILGNTDEFHPQVGLLQADGLDEMRVMTHTFFHPGDPGDPFPGSANNTTFNATSNPNSKAYSGADTLVSISNIPAASPTMKVNITVKAATQPPDQSSPFNPQTWYRLTNTLAGHALDVINDGAGNKEGLLQMARLDNVSGQFWQIVPNGAGTYALRTLFLGPKRQLDVYSDDKLKPHLATAGASEGQIWTIAPWGDGTWHLENKAGGRDLFLDTMEGGTRVAMNAAMGGWPTQRWRITVIKGISEAGF